MLDTLEIGNYINFSYEEDGEATLQKAIVVDKYLFNKEVPRIGVGCTFGSHQEKEVYVLETLSLCRYVVLKDELIDYEIISKTVYQKPNYLNLKIGTRVKIYNDIYGTYKVSDKLLESTGTILMIYTNEEGSKIAVLLHDKNGKLEVPLVNCIAL